MTQVFDPQRALRQGLEAQHADALTQHARVLRQQQEAEQARQVAEFRDNNAQVHAQYINAARNTGPQLTNTLEALVQQVKTDAFKTSFDILSEADGNIQFALDWVKQFSVSDKQAYVALLDETQHTFEQAFSYRYMVIDPLLKLENLINTGVAQHPDPILHSDFEAIVVQAVSQIQTLPQDLLVGLEHSVDIWKVDVAVKPNTIFDNPLSVLSTQRDLQSNPQEVAILKSGMSTLIDRTRYTRRDSDKTADVVINHEGQMYTIEPGTEALSLQQLQDKWQADVKANRERIEIISKQITTHTDIVLDDFVKQFQSEDFQVAWGQAKSQRAEGYMLKEMIHMAYFGVQREVRETVEKVDAHEVQTSTLDSGIKSFLMPSVKTILTAQLDEDAPAPSIETPDQLQQWVNTSRKQIHSDIELRTEYLSKQKKFFRNASILDDSWSMNEAVKDLTKELLGPVGQRHPELNAELQSVVDHLVDMASLTGAVRQLTRFNQRFLDKPITPNPEPKRSLLSKLGFGRSEDKKAANPKP